MNGLLRSGLYLAVICRLHAVVVDEANSPKSADSGTVALEVNPAGRAAPARLQEEPAALAHTATAESQTEHKASQGPYGAAGSTAYGSGLVGGSYQGQTGMVPKMASPSMPRSAGVMPTAKPVAKSCVIPMWDSTQYVCTEHSTVSKADTWKDLSNVKRKKVDDASTCTVACPAGDYDAYFGWMYSPSVVSMLCEDGEWNTATTKTNVVAIKCSTSKCGYLAFLGLLAAAFYYYQYYYVPEQQKQAHAHEQPEVSIHIGETPPAAVPITQS